MTTVPPSTALDLLVIGALTIDRFADGSSASGGSVLHIARAAARHGVTLGVRSVAGPEPEARAGIAELRRLCALVEVTNHDATWTFRHRESGQGRRLWIERAGGPIPSGAQDLDGLPAHATLYAPVADELLPNTLPAGGDGWHTGAILQGWLRAPTEGAEVAPLALASLPGQLRDALASLGVLVASREDLAASGATPQEQLAALRSWVGRGPTLVVTDGADGLWLDRPGVMRGTDIRQHVPAPRVVANADTVGAGDILAAFLTMAYPDPFGPSVRDAELGMRVVAEELEARKAERR